MNLSNYEVHCNSIFYIGYIIGAMTWAKLAQAFPLKTGKFIAFAVFTWSALILLTRMFRLYPTPSLHLSHAHSGDSAFCTTFAGIMTVRFILGMFESIIGPVFVILTSNWWTRSEQSFRSCVWLSGTPVSGSHVEYNPQSGL
jgi:MFS family permease